MCQVGRKIPYVEKLQNANDIQDSRIMEGFDLAQRSRRIGEAKLCVCMEQPPHIQALICDVWKIFRTKRGERDSKNCWSRLLH